jgi:purine-binding chemotaxis protein CheW
MLLVEFKCGGHRFGLPLRCVRKILPSAQPAVLPGAPEIVLGVLNIGGEVVTIIDFCRRIGLPGTAIHTSQRLVIVELADFPVGFLVDDVPGVTDRHLSDVVGVPEKFAGAAFVKALMRLDDGLCVIIDPENFLLDEETVLLRDALGNV